MPRDSNGNASTDSVYVATPGTTIRAVQHNTPIADIIQMLTGSLARNGTGGMLADLAMGGFKITGLSDGTSAQDAVTKAQLDAATAPSLPALGEWTNVASASTVDLGAQASRNLVITGTTTITSFGTAGAADNVPYLVRFEAALTLTNGASLILPGAANITTAAGDVAVIVHDTASVWRVVNYAAAAVSPGFESQAGAEAGTGTKKPMNSLRTAQAIAALSTSFGIGQTLQNVTASRYSGGVFQNTTNKTIHVFFYGTPSSSGYIEYYIGPTSSPTQVGIVGVPNGIAGGVNFPVPPQWYYSIVVNKVPYTAQYEVK